MCFSITASFTASAVLAVAGTITTAMAYKKNKKLLLLASVPLFFALQQFSEGLVWYAFQHAETYIRLFSLFFLFFAYFFWPVWMPLAVLAIEPKRKKLLKYLQIPRSMLRGQDAMGNPKGSSAKALPFGRERELSSRAAKLLWIKYPVASHGVFYLNFLLSCIFALGIYLPLVIEPSWLQTNIYQHSIYYDTQFLFGLRQHFSVVLILYTLLSVGPFLISSLRVLNVFGWLLLASLIISLIFYVINFISIWCFFAAILSLYLIYAIRVLVQIKTLK